MNELDEIVDGAPDDGYETETYERNQRARAELASLRETARLVREWGEAMLTRARVSYDEDLDDAEEEAERRVKDAAVAMATAEAERVAAAGGPK